MEQKDKKELIVVSHKETVDASCYLGQFWRDFLRILRNAHFSTSSLKSDITNVFSELRIVYLTSNSHSRSLVTNLDTK